LLYHVLFPEIPNADAFDRNQLRESLQEFGLDEGHEPIVDEDGGIIDGRTRLELCEELGIECPPRVVEGWDDERKWAYAFRHNMARRHLSPSSRRNLIREDLLRRPWRSNRAIAREAGVSDKTVAAVRNELNASDAEFPQKKSLGDLTRERDEAEWDEPPRVESELNHKGEIRVRVRVEYPVNSEEVRTRGTGAADLSYLRESAPTEWTGRDMAGEFVIYPPVNQWKTDADTMAIARAMAEQFYRRARAVPPLTMDAQLAAWK
jgi:ParB-like chromosome segregation protein Spo0J